jgi:hypothetical protein
MKTRLILLFIMFHVFAHAQRVNQLFYPSYTFQEQDQKSHNELFRNLFPQLNKEGITIALKFKKYTKYTAHYEYSLLFHQLPVVQACIKLNTTLGGKVISIRIEHEDLSVLKTNEILHQMQSWQALQIDAWIKANVVQSSDVKQSKFAILFQDNNPSVVLELDRWNTTLDQLDYVAIDGQILQSFDRTRRVKIDTIVNCKVFNPDPLTSLNQIYGGIYLDNADAASTWFIPAYVNKSFPAQFETSNNTFYLENKWVVIEDVENPIAAPVTSVIPSFYFNRNESGFEDCNVMYHIATFQDYIASLGYDTLMDIQAKIDPHALFGADNSMFLPNGGNPLMKFGTGGVDDAEDADVIIHEYCHGISWSANENSSFTAERSGLDEGLADYFATSYSRTINPFNWEKMFSWDGNNEYWSGRIANTNALYPSSGNIYAVGELWNSAMSAIWTDLGNIITDKLMLESLHFYTNSTTLPEAAGYIMQADTILFGGIHAATICNRFQQRQIFDVDCKPVGLESLNSKPMFTIYNSIGFSHGQGDLSFQFSKTQSGVVKIYSLQGSLINQISFKQLSSISLNPNDFHSGIYIVHVSTPDGLQTFKINKF